MTTGRLERRCALVTGAANGIGAAVARRFVAEGARVLLADVDDVEGAALAGELGPNAVYHHLDVGDEDAWSGAVDAAVTAFGSLNVLVNNAGTVHIAPLAQTSLADYERVIRVNQIGAFLGMRSVVEPMSDSGGGSIVNVSSVEGLAGMPFVIAYTASKFAVRGMTKSAAIELGPKGIRVNSIHPGVIDTSLASKAMGGAEIDFSAVGKGLPLGRVGTPEEIADLALYLAGDESRYSTGAEFVADGGATATYALKP